MAWSAVGNIFYIRIYLQIGRIHLVAADIESGRGHIVAAYLKETVPGVFRDRHYGDGAVDFPLVTRELKAQGVGLYNAEFWYDPAYKGGDWQAALRETHDFLRPLLEE